MKFLSVVVLSATAYGSLGKAFFAPIKHNSVAFAGRRAFVGDIARGLATNTDHALTIVLETRGGSSKTKKTSPDEEERLETVDADQLYLPGLLKTVITRTNKVGS